MDRAEILLRGLPKTARVIEIGPSYNGLVPKRDGWNAVIIDHASRDDLVAKYGGDPAVDTARIEKVDYVWNGGSLAELVPVEEHGTFDAFIASHVIEHTTDVVSFLRTAEILLKPDGQIILAVPDKRKCFDLLRTLSNTGQAIEAFLSKRDRHTVATHVNHWLNIAQKDGSSVFSIDDIRPVQFANDPAGAVAWITYADADHYIDAHAWTWTPASFELMAVELAQLGYLGSRVEAVQDAEYTEFYAWLRKGFDRLSSNEFQARRVELNYRVIAELAEQTRQIPGGLPVEPALSQAPASVTRSSALSGIGGVWSR